MTEEEFVSKIAWKCGCGYLYDGGDIGVEEVYEKADRFFQEVTSHSNAGIRHRGQLGLMLNLCEPGGERPTWKEVTKAVRDLQERAKTHDTE